MQKHYSCYARGTHARVAPWLGRVHSVPLCQTMRFSHGEHLTWSEDWSTRELELTLVLPPATHKRAVSVEVTVDCVRAVDSAEGGGLLLEAKDIVQALRPDETTWAVEDNKQLVVTITPVTSNFPWGRHLVGAMGKITTWADAKDS